MIRRRAIAALVGMLASAAGLVLAQQPSLSGEWTFVSGSTDSSRDGSKGERPTKSHTTSGAAFNCGGGCRIVQQGSTLTIDKAQLSGGDGSPGPAVTLQLDGQPQTVVDSFNRGNKIDALSRWDKGTLLIKSTAYGWPLTQAISLEQNQLVVVTTSSTGAGWTTSLRYAKK